MPKPSPVFVFVIGLCTTFAFGAFTYITVLIIATRLIR